MVGFTYPKTYSMVARLLATLGSDAAQSGRVRKCWPLSGADDSLATQLAPDARAATVELNGNRAGLLGLAFAITPAATAPTTPRSKRRAATPVCWPRSCSRANPGR